METVLCVEAFRGQTNTAASYVIEFVATHRRTVVWLVSKWDDANIWTIEGKHEYRSKWWYRHTNKETHSSLIKFIWVLCFPVKDSSRWKNKMYWFYASMVYSILMFPITTTRRLEYFVYRTYVNGVKERTVFLEINSLFYSSVSCRIGDRKQIC